MLTNANRPPRARLLRNVEVVAGLHNAACANAADATDDLARTYADTLARNANASAIFGASGYFRSGAFRVAGLTYGDLNAIPAVGAVGQEPSKHSRPATSVYDFPGELYCSIPPGRGISNQRGDGESAA